MAKNPKQSENGEPIGELNTTPLIDVMLVLLIMFIITLPKMTDAVKVDLPADCNRPECNKTIVRPINTLSISANSQIFWNDKQISGDALAKTLTVSAGMNPLPELRFIPDADAPYATVNKVLALTRGSGVKEIGFVGNERYQTVF
jgi:biopolymer transport protein ExbD